MASENGNKIVAGVPDLFFAAKIGETARQVGVAIEFASSAAALLEKASGAPSLVILDLGAAALDPIKLIAQLKAGAATGGVRIVGFVNHERADLIEQAREAGCDQVLARGAFASQLPALLTQT
jgi:CheY-like chemotaxis protein